MKKVKDSFSYSARWDSIGLSCCFCKYYDFTIDTLTNNLKSIRCNLHNISLDIELTEDGFLEGEWLCKNYEDIGKSFPDGVKEFSSIKDELEEKVLYKACAKEYLEAVSFNELKF